MHTLTLLYLLLCPMDLQGDRFIWDHLVIDQHGVDVVIPWDESERLALATEWQEPHWHRALALRLIRNSYEEIDWIVSDTYEFFTDMPFVLYGWDTKYQTMLRGIIEDY